MIAHEVQDWIDRLQLNPHPEGGFYRETYRSAHSTAIYYLLPGSHVSRLHRLKSDELFHHYAGTTLTVHVLAPDGSYEARLVGGDAAAGALPQTIVPGGHWFGATVEQPDGYALVGCTVSPPFEFANFEMADRERLVAEYPAQRVLIERLT